MTFIPRKETNDEEIWSKIKSHDIYKQMMKVMPESERADIESSLKELLVPMTKNMTNAMLASKAKKK